MRLEDLSAYPHPAGFQHSELFDNGFGVSVVPEVTLGEDPLYELAVFRHVNKKKAHLAYDTSITDDVIRYCTVDDVDKIINRIRNFDPNHYHDYGHDDEDN